MQSKLIQVGDNFWNIRGSFKIGGVVDIGTQASLVRRDNGKFVFLDACAMSTKVKRQLDELTDGGSEVEAILNVHPFHTVSVANMHANYPQAKLFGTARHIEHLPDLPWQKAYCENPALHKRYAGDFEFSVPAGVDFISANENVHFSSVLVFHPASNTIHVDDTLMFVRLPKLANTLGIANPLVFHPTLSRALQPRAGAAQDFRQWAGDIAERWQRVENLCAAHTAPLLGQKAGKRSIGARILAALDKVEPTLAKHERKYG